MVQDGQRGRGLVGRTWADLVANLPLWLLGGAAAVFAGVMLFSIAFATQPYSLGIFGTYGPPLKSGSPDQLLPKGAIIAFDDPGGCSKLGEGWEDSRFEGKVLVGAGEGRWAYRVSGGDAQITIQKQNIPTLYLGYRTAQSGPGITLSMVEKLSFDRPDSPQILQTSNSAPEKIDIMPPYVPIYFCRLKN